MSGRHVVGVGAILAVVGCNQLWGVDELTPGAAPPVVAVGGGGSGGSSATGAGGQGAAASGGGGAGGASTCVSSADCVDGNPCTVGTCGADGCEQTAVPAGEAGTGEGDCVGTCQADGACGLSLYSFAFPSGSAGVVTKEALSVAWSGPDAPPPRGILAAAHGHLVDLLIVFSDADGGTSHVRAGGSWVSSPSGVRFPGLDGLTVNSATIYQNTVSSAPQLTVTTPGSAGLKLAFIYDVDAQGQATPNSGNPFVIMESSEPQAGPQHSVDADWEMSVQTAFQGTPDWVIFWRSYEAQVYEVNGGDFSWQPHGADISSPLWYPPLPELPASGTTVAAYHEGGTAYLVAP